MKCAEVQKFLYIYLDGEMEDADRREVMSHITECPACTRAIAVERAVLRTIRTRTPRAAAPQWLRDRLTTRVHGASSVALFFRELKLHPIAAAAAAAAFLIILTVQHAQTIFGPPGAAPAATRAALSAFLSDPARIGMHPVLTGARASLTGAGYFNVNDRTAAQKHRRAAPPRVVYTGFDTLRLRPVDPRPGYLPGRRHLRLAHGGMLGAPRPGPYAVSYAMAAGAPALDADETVYFEADPAP